MWSLGTWALIQPPLNESCHVNLDELIGARFGTGLLHFAAGAAYALPLAVIGWLRRKWWLILISIILVAAGIGWAISGLHDWKCIRNELVIQSS
jgi:hypothetical protein